jgi:HAD superfamily hydrolase (TIGR01509 family)
MLELSESQTNQLKNKLQSAEAFVFDMDGTLVDLEKLNFESFASSIKKILYKYLTPKEYQLYFSGVGSEAGFHNYLKSINGPQDKFSSLLTSYRQYKRLNLKANIKNVVFLKDGAKEFLEKLKLKNKKVALATSTINEFTQLVLDTFGLNEYFQVVLTIQDITKGKPDPEIFNLALEKLRTTSEKAICFEDSANGIQAAKNANLYTVGILTPGLNDDYVHNADIVIDSYKTCIELL